MIEVEVLGAELAPAAPPPATVQDLCERAAAACGVSDGHVAVEFVSEQRIAELNERHRGRAGTTDVLSFPVDGAEPMPPAPAGGAVPRELGDIVICPECTTDLSEAIVHGMLHLLGMDHEQDDGEMLALQDSLLAQARP
jgi:probable rRNA maturation factor